MLAATLLVLLAFLPAGGQAAAAGSLQLVVEPDDGVGAFVSFINAAQHTIDGEVYLVQLRRNRLARRYTLRIHSATREVVLTLPPRGSLKQARELAQRHGAWIAPRPRVGSGVCPNTTIREPSK